MMKSFCRTFALVSKLKQISHHLSQGSATPLLSMSLSVSRKMGSTSTETSVDYVEASDPETFDQISKDVAILKDFISEEEEQVLFDEINPYIRRLPYEDSHWDDAIHYYKETQRSHWNDRNKMIIDRIRNTAFPSETDHIPLVHVLDLHEDGYIKPHVDSVKFCGDTIAGLNLLSTSVMRYVHEEDPSKWADVLLSRRSLYILKGVARYKYTHAILKEEESFFKNQHYPRGRRISVICRNEPPS